MAARAAQGQASERESGGDRLRSVRRGNGGGGGWHWSGSGGPTPARRAVQGPGSASRWHGRPMCSLVGDVLPGSLKIGLQTQTQPPPPPPLDPPLPAGPLPWTRVSSREKMQFTEGRSDVGHGPLGFGTPPPSSLLTHPGVVRLRG